MNLPPNSDGRDEIERLMTTLQQVGKTTKA
jgi:hypothetical protein